MTYPLFEIKDRRKKAFTKEENILNRIALGLRCIKNKEMVDTELELL